MEVDWDFRLKYVLFSLYKHKSLKMIYDINKYQGKLKHFPLQ